ncbi:MAG: glycosyltransferase family 4 protein [Deltaproteobacteria bacterium]|nr:glycosyltransferase family 4 protein [Deltaproteobacteria bacterium]
MVKILFVHERGGIGGAGNILYSLLAHIDKERFEPVVVLGSDGELADRIRELGFKCLSWPMPELVLFQNNSFLHSLVALGRNLRFIARTVFGLLYILHKENPDIVYANSLQAQFASCFAAKLFKKALVWHVHNIQPAGFRQRTFNALVRLFPDKVIVVSKAVWDNVVGSKQTLSKIRLVYNGINAQVFASQKGIHSNIRDEFDIPNECKIVTMVSALSPWKGHVYFLKAMRLVVKQFPHLKILLVGDIILKREQNYRQRLLELARELQINDHILFTGFRNDAVSIMSQSDIIVLPSIKAESFPTVILEAMAVAKPVVATKVGGIPEMVEHEKTGLLVPPQDPKSLAEAIATLLANEDYSNRLGQSGLRRLKEMFGMDKFIAGIEDVLSGVLENGIC